MTLSATIHPTAVIHPSSEIGDGVDIGAYAIIGEHVRIGDRTTVGHHTVIEGRTAIGQDNHIFHFVSIGSYPQDIKYKGEDTRVEIGNGNLIREYVTVNRGTPQGKGVTTIGDRCFLMIGTHVAHDCSIGHDVIMANLVGLSGHVHVGDGAVFGGMAGVHQFVRIGPLAMIAGAAMVGRAVPPYVLAAGNRAKLFGLNVIGLKRKNISSDAIAQIKRIFKIIFREGLTRKEALAKARGESSLSPEADRFIAFLEEPSKRGICPASSTEEEEWEG